VWTLLVVPCARCGKDGGVRCCDRSCPRRKHHGAGERLLPTVDQICNVFGVQAGGMVGILPTGWVTVSEVAPVVESKSVGLPFSLRQIVEPAA